MKKICFFSRTARPLFDRENTSKHGGAELQLYTLSREIKKRNYYVSFILGGKGPADSDGVKLRYINNLNGRKFYKLFTNFFEIMYIIKNEKPNFIVFRSALVENIFLIIFSKFLNIKTVFMIAHERQLSFGHHKGILFDILNKFLLIFSSKIICQSNYQLKMLKNYNHKSSLVRSIHKEVKHDNRIGEDIIWIGRDISWKRFHIVEKLASLFPQYNFKILGLNGISKLENISFLGFVKFEHTWDKICDSRILINTSISEGFPNTFIQSWICGKPVISLNVDPDNLIGDYKVGYCANDNFNLFAASIKYFMTNESIIKKVKKNSKIIMKEVFNPNSNIDKFEKILTKNG